MPKKLKYQYSVSVSFQKKSMIKQANQADLTNCGELKFVLNRHLKFKLARKYWNIQINADYEKNTHLREMRTLMAQRKE